ncbi:hypothetical protein C5167_025191 [Papaver somniferum]|uniref:Uncharacterized protein n=1 Tax=Papaver somniferum TaxID=3469 RepID=A0A4Y7JSD2_PAPSO|nr:hypothetical protein C5167_025191 [Papaver somniferum]
MPAVQIGRNFVNIHEKFAPGDILKMEKVRLITDGSWRSDSSGYDALKRMTRVFCLLLLQDLPGLTSAAKPVYEAHRCAVLQPKQRNAVPAAAQECLSRAHQLTSRPLISSPSHPINMKANFQVPKICSITEHLWCLPSIFQPLNA